LGNAHIRADIILYAVGISIAWGRVFKYTFFVWIG